MKIGSGVQAVGDGKKKGKEREGKGTIYLFIIKIVHNGTTNENKHKYVNMYTNAQKFSISHRVAKAQMMRSSPNLAQLLI